MVYWVTLLVLATFSHVTGHKPAVGWSRIALQGQLASLCGPSPSRAAQDCPRAATGREQKLTWLTEHLRAKLCNSRLAVTPPTVHKSS